MQKYLVLLIKTLQKLCGSKLISFIFSNKQNNKNLQYSYDIVDLIILISYFQ